MNAENNAERVNTNTKQARGRIGKILLNALVIFFSVTLSILFNNWNADKKQKSEVATFLTDLKEDLRLDIESMEEHKKVLEDLIVQTTALCDSLTNRDVDSENEKKFGITMNLIFRKTNNGTFEGFKSSGKISNISDNTIKKDILKYYQSDIKILEDSEELLNNRILLILDLTVLNDQGENHKERMLMNLGITNQVISMIIKSYTENIEFANTIINEI